MRWIGILPLVLACAHDKAAPAPANAVPPRTPIAAPTPAPPKGPIRLFTDAEIDASTTAVLARLAENAKRSCPAPKLLADTAKGTSGPDLLAIVEGQGAFADCMARLDKLTRDQWVAHAPEVVAVDKDCAEPIATAVHRAEAFEDGCSPYQVGVHVDAKEIIRPLQVARLLANRASNAALPAAGIGMLVDAIRMAQDLTRGHVTLIAAMVGVATTELAAAELDALLDTAKLKPAQLENLAGALDRLIAAAPSFHELLEGEREAQELFAIMGMKPVDWVPPGGIGDFHPHLDPDGKHVADPRDEGAAMLAAAQINADDRAKACPANATLEACRVGLAAIPPRTTRTDLELESLWKQGQVDEPGMRMRMRQQIIDILAAVGAPMFAPYVVKQMSVVQRLAELRIHVEVLRTHKCPPTYELPPALGRPLEVVADKGSLTVATWTFRCR